MAADEINPEVGSGYEGIDQSLLNQKTRERLLEKVKRVANSISRRVRQVTEDTDVDLTPLSNEQTKEEFALGNRGDGIDREEKKTPD